jgi:hypothetical protein
VLPCGVREALFFRNALVVALVAHAATLLAFERLGSYRRAPSAEAFEPFEVRIEEVPIEAIDTPSPPPETASELTPEKVPASRVALETNAAHRDGPSGPSEPGEPAPVAAPGPPRPADSAGQPWTYSPTAPVGSVWIGLRASPNGASSLTGSGRVGQGRGRAGQDDGAPPSATGAADSVRAALESQDLEMGLSAGGPLVGPTRDAVRTSLVPDFAHALLEFTTDETGLVVSVRVLDSNSDVHVWDEVAQKITADARKKPLRVPRGAQGLAVTMQVESKMVSASGHDLREGTLKRIVSGMFDPTDLLLDSQDKPQRVVQARVVSERRL